jgi:hypothetical protein
MSDSSEQDSLTATTTTGNATVTEDPTAAYTQTGDAAADAQGPGAIMINIGNPVRGALGDDKSEGFTGFSGFLGMGTRAGGRRRRTKRRKKRKRRTRSKKRRTKHKRKRRRKKRRRRRTKRRRHTRRRRRRRR